MGEPRSSEDSASEPGSATNLPGLSELRDAVANRLLPRLPGFAALRRDGLAGLSSAISNVPDGMANGVLVGVNPVYGLYATMMGPAVGGLLSSTQLMLITTTAAASLSTSQALGGLQGERARRSALRPGDAGGRLSDPVRPPRAREADPLRILLGNDRLPERRVGAADPQSAPCGHGL